MCHRLFEKQIPPLHAFIAVLLIGSVATALIVRTIDTVEFLASETFSSEGL